jgi:hypothetical protein
MSMPEVLDGLPGRMAGWAVNRSLAPNSVTGISLALGICAAAWFSGGTRADNVKGAIALAVAYLTWQAARWLARRDEGPAGGPWAARPGACTLADLGGAASDCAVLTGLAVGGYEAHWSGTWELAAAIVVALAVRGTAVACGGQVAASPGEGNPLGSAIRRALAFPVGGRVAVIVVVAPVWGAHATLLILLEWGIVATAYVITGHGPQRVGAERSRAAGQVISAGSSAQVASSARPELAARVDSAPVVDSSVTDASVPVRTPAPPPPPADVPVGVDAATAATAVNPVNAVNAADAGEAALWAGAPAPAPASAPADSLVPADPPARMGARGLSAAALTPLTGEAGQSETRLALAASSEPTMTLDLMIHREPARPREERPKTVLDPRARATIAAYRDDGVVAVWLSRVVRGEFVPLPPAVAGLAATSFLAWLGMRNLPGLLVLTPLVVMLLAAFGAGHPHDGRFDWLVPAVLVAGQLVYIAAIGFSFGVVAPVTFTLCALILLRYVDLARRGRGAAALGADTRLGWEGRMLAAGAGAMLGIAIVAYVALAVYLVALICGKVRTSGLAIEAGERS